MSTHDAILSLLSERDAARSERDDLARRVADLEAMLSEARGWIATDRPWNAQDLIARVDAALAVGGEGTR